MNKKLEEALHTPMRTILAVRVCFDFCENVEDIADVIKKIPAKFGEFRLLAAAPNEGYFAVQNLFEKDGKMNSQIITHDFYTAASDLYYDREKDLDL